MEKFKSFNQIYLHDKGPATKPWLIGLGLIMLGVLFLPWTQNIRSKGQITSLYQEQKPQKILKRRSKTHLSPAAQVSAIVGKFQEKVQVSVKPLQKICVEAHQKMRASVPFRVRPGQTHSFPMWRYLGEYYQG